MVIQTRTLSDGKTKRYKARVKWHGREVASQVFTRKNEAKDWHDDQVRKLKMGQWVDPKRGKVALDMVATEWLKAGGRLKESSRREDARAWRNHIEPKFGRAPVASITTADVERWLGELVTKKGLKPSTAKRQLATFRSLLDFAVKDRRINGNVAMEVEAPTGGKSKREGQYLTKAEIEALTEACAIPRDDDGKVLSRLDENGKPISNPYADVVKVLALGGLRWGEVAGLQVRDLVSVPGRGLRLQRAVLSDSDTGRLYEETLKGHQARTVPLVSDLVPIIDRWADGKKPGDWLFHAPKGGPLAERNWKRSMRWGAALKTIDRAGFRVHDLRHTCASIWLGAGADPKVVQRILGHASATMTMDLYGHLYDQNLWTAAKQVGGLSGASEPANAKPEPDQDASGDDEGEAENHA